MNHQSFYFKLSIILLMIAILLGTYCLPAGSYQPPEMTSVIVQGTPPAELALAIAQHGGRVTGELAIIQSVVAQVPTSALKALEAHPAIRRVWLNSNVSQASTLETAGTLAWTASTNTLVDQTPVLRPDGTLILADKYHTLYAFAPDGSLRWTFDTAGDLGSAPAVGSDNSVYIGDRSGQLYALDPAGQLLWQYNHQAAIKHDIAVAHDGTIALVSKKQLYLLDNAGNLLDSFKAQSTILTAPTFSANGEVVYFGDRGRNFYAYSTSDGLLWQLHKDDLRFQMTPVTSPDDTAIYTVVSGRFHDWIWATNSDGSERWSFPVDGHIDTPPTVGADNIVYVGDSSGKIYLIDPAGTLLRTITTDRPVKSNVVSASDGTILAAVGKQLHAWTANGEQWFEFQAQSNIKAGPVLSVDQRTVYFTDRRRNLYAVHTGLGETNDPAPNTAYPQVIGAPDVWAQNVTGDNVGVAVVDTGIAPLDGLLYNAQGEARLVGWVDFIDGSPLPIDPSGHGTHVAGIIANSETTESGAYAGIAANVNLIGVRVLDETGAGTYASAIAGLDWLVANQDAFDLRVVNMSLTALPQSHYWDDPLNQAVMATWAAGIVVVTAAGNEGPAPMSITVPGNVPYVITVGAFTDNFTPDELADDFLAPFSAAGPTWDGFVKPDVIAPGAHMISLMPDDSVLGQAHADKQVAENYYQMAGTSAAAPVVTGLSALMLEVDPNLTPDQVKYRLMKTALTAGTDTDNDGELDLMVPSMWQQGSGRVWAPEAVFTDTAGLANNGLDVDLDLAGTEHYIGYTQYFTETEYFFLNGTGDWVWSGGDWVWSGSPNTIWDGGDWVWSGGDWVWSGGDWVWSGGDWVWSGGDWVWSGGDWVWSGGDWVWSGGDWVWSGDDWVWSGGDWVWSGGDWVWSGGDWVWSGGLDQAAVNLGSWIIE